MTIHFRPIRNEIESSVDTGFLG